MSPGADKIRRHSKTQVIGQPRQICYVASISDLLDFRKFTHRPASMLNSKLSRYPSVCEESAKVPCEGHAIQLGIENLEATLSEVQSVIQSQIEHYESY